MPSNLMIPPMFDISTSIHMDGNHIRMILDKDTRTKSTSTIYIFCLGLHMECSLDINIDTQRTSDTFLGFLSLYTMS